MDRESAQNNVAYALLDGHSCAARNPRTTVNDLPPDVLLIILRDVFRDALQEFRRRGKLSRATAQFVPRSPFDDFVTDSSRCSAEHLASVCPQWREAMSSSSIFWAQIVVWTGANPTPLTKIRQYLAWSREQPLHIYVIRRFSPSLEDRTEKAHVKAIVELLLPHVQRLKVLCMKLLHSSSLPLPRAFITPVLEELSMGGVHFLEAYLDALLRSPILPMLTHLFLTGYASHHRPIPLIDLLQCLVLCQHIEVVRFTSLQLDASHTDRSLLQSHDWGADAHFTDMSGDVIAEFHRLLYYPWGEVLSYTRCSMPSRSVSLVHDSPLGQSYYLNLNEIEDPEALFHFLVPCAEMSICDSDGLQPEVLRALAGPIYTDRGDDVWLCPDLSGLHVSGCRHVSSADLRAVLEARLEAHSATGFAGQDDDGYVVRSVTDLSVRDCGKLAPEDKVWFDKNVESVHWDYWTGGTRRHHFMIQMTGNL
ncbi:uncharacterized protein B0H18DRAFT_1011525 [Fomitopsis serialis]|uniref:uncharacterized protein n=1 Tax=Fomitopsis serialis TaxID=139415 RepID=UPI002007B676|nr:uncharacterized protein B0H18DRAFT_1011525 [Neoantrodia serialis]KAH9924519.1 hypothetical protein B0H18DRAFT_1011525 [Neoantrodia serialis]